RALLGNRLVRQNRLYRPITSQSHTHQAPPIRVYHAGHAALYILHLIFVLLWLAAYLPRMPLEHRETQDWLRPGGPTCLALIRRDNHCRIPEP
uniref:Suf domain-containing protein n=1 Tax=Mesocestoides corti TaxID=53468 RepID=A0A5K3F6J4_MESCO